jgi:hypothetical protein
VLLLDSTLSGDRGTGGNEIFLKISYGTGERSGRFNR